MAYSNQCRVPQRNYIIIRCGLQHPVIIRFPFERMAAQFPQTTLVRFNRDYLQLNTEGVDRYLSFVEDVDEVMALLNR